MILGVVLSGLITLLPLPATADLTPEIQADLYLVQTEAYIKEKNYAAAQEAMGKILDLQEEHGLKLPDYFHFKYAQVLEWAGSYAEAIESLNRYLELAGRSGTHYREALSLLHEAMAEEAKDDAAFAEAKTAGTVGAYEAYLRKYENGRHVGEARRLQIHAQDDAAFAEAKKTGTSTAYGAYLRAYPSGRHAAQARRLQAALTARVKEVVGNIKMVVVPAGSYVMGSPSSEVGRGNAEGPQHRVTIRESFAVGAYEVTFEEWDACVTDGGCGGYRPGDEGWGRGRRPVINVNWEDAQRYVKWLRDETGEVFRLLSEAEWEYVARAGTTTPYHYGRTITMKQVNGKIDGSRYGKTLPVGSFDANEFGLHDVHGNVYEWVQDCWNGRYQGAPSDGSAWERGNCGRRVVRGGSWYYFPWSLRSASRSRGVAGSRYGYVGFRVARTLTS